MSANREIFLSPLSIYMHIPDRFGAVAKQNPRVAQVLGLKKAVKTTYSDLINIAQEADYSQIALVPNRLIMRHLTNGRLTLFHQQVATFNQSFQSTPPLGLDRKFPYFRSPVV